jgi:hypothetical protein
MGIPANGATVIRAPHTIRRAGAIPDLGIVSDHPTPIRHRHPTPDRHPILVEMAERLSEKG